MWGFFLRVDDDYLTGLGVGLEPYSRTAYVHLVLEYNILFALPIVQPHHQLAAVVILVHVVVGGLQSAYHAAAHNAQVVLSHVLALAQSKWIHSTHILVVLAVQDRLRLQLEVDWILLLMQCDHVQYGALRKY